MSILRARPIGGSTLVREYLEGSSPAATFYGRSPFDLESYREKLGEVQTRFGPEERRRVAAAVTPTTDRARQRLERFVAEGGAVVTTGQQTGLFTGPLFTVYKILSAVALAEHLASELGVTVLPVFWSASEDHDWAEVNHAHLLDPRGRLHRISLPDGDQRPLPMSERRLENDLESLYDEALQIVGAEGDTNPLVKGIIEPFRRAGTTMAEAFREAVTTLFAGVDLLVTDAADPALKAASAGVLRQALTDAGAHEERLRARSAALREAGYASQVAVLDGGTNVFLRTEAGRERLYRQGGGAFGVRERRSSWEAAEILEILAESPGRLSPNVLLRPVVESAVFPTLAYVGGPGEIAYFAQAAALFEEYGIEMPVVVPRYSATVIEPGIARALAKLELREEDLATSHHALAERLARREMPPTMAEAIQDTRGRIAAGFERMIEEALEVDPTLGAALGGLRNRALAGVGRAERKVLRAIKRREGEALGQLERVLTATRPLGLPQDRVLNVLPFLARYGEHFVEEVHQSIRTSWRLPVASR